MKTTRRAFLGGLAAASIPVGAAAATTVQPETQENKCIRLARELLAEFSKLPSHGRSKVGPFVDLRGAAGVDCLRFVRGDDGLDTLVAMISAEEFIQ
ncbi:UNVERIFIED_ORG: hypothetical protein J2W19_003131 [Shinella zoogloeoides]|nr:hypothetical protein [Shinella zoogloeoides]